MTSESLEPIVLAMERTYTCVTCGALCPNGGPPPECRGRCSLDAPTLEHLAIAAVTAWNARPPAQGVDVGKQYETIVAVLDTFHDGQREKKARAICQALATPSSEGEEASDAAKIATYEDAHATAVDLGYPSITEALEALDRTPSPVSGGEEAAQIIDKLAHRLAPAPHNTTCDDKWVKITMTLDAAREHVSDLAALKAATPSPVSPAILEDDVLEIIERGRLGARLSAAEQAAWTGYELGYVHGRKEAPRPSPEGGADILRRHERADPRTGLITVDFEAAAAEVLAALSPQGVQETWMPTHRHVRRGSTYEVIGTALMQVASGIEVSDDEECTVYRGEDGRLWVRPTAEFNDGRFDDISALEGKAP
jgi:hypothetical protein